MESSEIFCPICNRVITAQNGHDVTLGLHDAFLFVHDDKPHPEGWDADPEAMRSGLQ